MKLELPLIEFFGRGGALKSSWYGDCLPSRDFPMLIDLYLQGRLPLQDFVSETIGIGDVEAAFEKMHRGEVLRSVVVLGPVTAGVERVVTSGVFSLDGQDFDVDNNVWLVGDETSVVIVDAAHDAATILAAVGDRTVSQIVCTHAHNDHVNAVRDLVAATGATVRLHPDDQMLWDVVNEGVAYEPLADGDVIDAAGAALVVIHTPGHSPGGVCLWSEQLGVVLTGDTLFHGGTGRHRTVVQPLPDDPRLDPRAAARPADADARADRARRRDDDRGRGRQLRRLGGTRPLGRVRTFPDMVSG